MNTTHHDTCPECGRSDFLAVHDAAYWANDDRKLHVATAGCLMCGITWKEVYALESTGPTEARKPYDEVGTN